MPPTETIPEHDTGYEPGDIGSPKTPPITRSFFRRRRSLSNSGSTSPGAIRSTDNITTHDPTLTTTTNTTASMERGRSPSYRSSTASGLTLRQKITRALSPNAQRGLDDHGEEGTGLVGGIGRRTSESSIMSRSQSRGRDQIVSTGRGGAGNFLRSPSRDKKLGIDESIIPGIERGRTASPAGVNKITHAGRGGSGNIRSPSTDPAARIRAEQEENLEDRLIHERRGRELATDAPFSTGRGGAGNIGGSTSRSRSRSAMGRTDSRQSVATGTTAATAIPSLGHELGRSSSPRHVHASGRGGWGNIAEDKVLTEQEKKDLALRQAEDEAIARRHYAGDVEEPLSTGKGGFGNIHHHHHHHPPAKDSTNGDIDLSALTLEEKEAYDKVHANDRKSGYSTGKGGAGNIFHSHSHHTTVDELKGEEDNHRGRDGKHSNGVIHNVLRSLSRATGSDKSRDSSK